MSEALILTITPHQSGVRLTWRKGSEAGGGLIFMEDVNSIIAHLKRGYIHLGLILSTDGTTSSTFRGDGSDLDSNA